VSAVIAKAMSRTISTVARPVPFLLQNLAVQYAACLSKVRDADVTISLLFIMTKGYLKLVLNAFTYHTMNARRCTKCQRVHRVVGVSVSHLQVSDS
jgi:biotin transporter BioY